MTIRFDLLTGVLALSLAMPLGAHVGHDHGDGAAEGEPAETEPSASHGDAESDEPALSIESNRTIAFSTDEVTWMSLAVVPDGSYVIEVLGDLYRLPAGGGSAERIRGGMQFDSQPAVSPDGSSLAWISDESGSEQVWLSDIDGENVRQLTEAGPRTEFASPVFSPDGQWIVVSRTTFGLSTFELVMYHRDGGKGLRLTKAKPTPTASRSQRNNALGAVFSSDGQYLYYARRTGGFEYNARFPMWQIARRDLERGEEDVITQAQGSGMRPALSPDGTQLVYATRFDGATGLRLRDLESGVDEWLVYPVQRDDQESRHTRDLFPGYGFTPSGDAVVYTAGGGLRRVDLQDRQVSVIPFEVSVEQPLGPQLTFPYRLESGPVRARLVRDIELSADGSRRTFAAFAQIFVQRDGEQPQALTAFGQAHAQPTFSPDGRSVAWVSWSSDGGHIWRGRADGRGRPRQLTETPAFYAEPAFSPDGEQIYALRATSYDRLYPEYDDGAPLALDVIRLPADGGAASLVKPARGLGRPHFGPEPDRVYFYQGAGSFGGDSGVLVSLRPDGTDRREHLKVKGPGIYFAEEPVTASDVLLSPDGRWALARHAFQLYVLAVPRHANGSPVEIDLNAGSVPVARLTHVGADYFDWADNGATIVWSVGHRVYRRALSSVEFRAVEDEPEDVGTADGDVAADVAENGSEGDDDAFEALEAHEAVSYDDVIVERPRHRGAGRMLLAGATVITMRGEEVLENADVLVEDGRIAAIGVSGSVDAAGAHVIDLSGRWLLPGYVDTHAHFRPMRRVPDMSNWAFLANLAWGVTTGLDVQPSTVDILDYQDLIDAGAMLGPRALSTGPGIFSHNDFKSFEQAREVLRRYRDHYRVHNLKAYISGNRQQRHWLARAAQELELMPTTEGALDLKLGLTHAIDGFHGNEHNLPVVGLHNDVVQLIAQGGMTYTPTLLVNYGGPWGENWFYTHEDDVHGNEKLRRFTPHPLIDARTQRVQWFDRSEYSFLDVAAQALKIRRAGGLVGVGAHGQLQGLGYHWELWALGGGGFTNHEALRAATIDGAKIIGVGEDVGSIEVGKLADMVVLTADPLDALRNSEKLQYVIKDGEVYETDTLDRVWPNPAALPDQWWWQGVTPW